MSPQKWDRRVILLSTAIPAVTNALVPFVVARHLGLAFVAIWLALRAYLSIGLACMPNPCTTLLQARSFFGNPEIYQRLKNSVFTYLILGPLAAGCIVALLVYLSGALREYESVLLALYAACFVVSTAGGVLIRVEQRSDLLLKVSLADTFFNLVSLALATVSIWAFVVCHICKELAKVAIAKHVLPAPARFSYPFREILTIGAPQTLRNILQIGSQYGDRMIMPLAFGLVAAGITGLGASLGAGISMFSSSAYIWALPRVLEGKADTCEWVVSEWARLNALIAGISCCFMIICLYSPVTVVPEGSGATVPLALCYAATVGVGFLGLVSTQSRALSTMAAFQHACCIGVSWVALFLAGLSGLSQSLSLSIAASAFMACIAAIYRLYLPKMRLLLGSMLYLLVAIWLLYVREITETGLWLTIGIGSIGFVGGFQYLLHLLKKRK